MRRAASVLNVEQSVISRRIRVLEARLGVQLFERGNGGTHPTTAGLELLAAARRITSDADAIHRKLVTNNRRRHPSLTIGVQVSPSTGNMPALLGELQRRSPDLEIRIKDGDRSSLLECLRNSRLDIAIVIAKEGDWPDAVLPLWSERVVAGFSAAHPLAAQNVVVPTDLVSEPLLLPERGPGEELANLFANIVADAKMRITVQSAALDRFLALAKCGCGTVLMLEGGTGMNCDGVVYREIHNNGRAIRIEMMACWSATNRNPALHGFLSLLTARYPKLSGHDEIRFPL